MSVLCHRNLHRGEEKAHAGAVEGDTCDLAALQPRRGMHPDMSALVPSWALQDESGIQAYMKFSCPQMSSFKSNPNHGLCDNITPAD